MSNDETIRSWKADDNAPSIEGNSAPENPAGDVNLSAEELEAVSGGTATLTCTGDPTYCQGTCGVPFTTYGCCKGGEE